MSRARLGLFGLIVCGACELEELNVPPAETIVVVQGVVRADQAQQWILVERTFNGTVASAEGGFIPGGAVPVPVQGADVTISNVSFPGDPCGSMVSLLEDAGPPDRIQPGTYWSASGCPTIRAGDTLELLVLSGSDRVVGRTIVPGTNSMVLKSNGDSVLVPGPALEFNRDTDTLVAEVDPISGRVLTIEIRGRIFVETPEFISEASTELWADATFLTLPGDFLNIFEADFDEPGENIPDLFNVGRLYAATLAYADRNFFDYLRSANSPLTGRGFINNLEGGFGLFGSMTAAVNNLRVIGNVDDPIEGIYRTTGTVDGVAVSVDWELYLNRGSDSTLTEFSSFLDGAWVFGAYDAWTTGTISGTSLTTFVVQPTGGTTPEGEPEIRRWDISGVLSGTGSTTLTVRVDNVDAGTLTATKQ